MFDGPLCWCDCLPEWKGNFDCSLKTVEVVIDETKADENATACEYIRQHHAQRHLSCTCNDSNRYNMWAFPLDHTKE